MREKSILSSKVMSLCVVLTILSLMAININSQPLTYPKLLEILKDFNHSPFVNLLFIYDSSTQTGKGLQTYIPIISQNKKEYYISHLLDCNTEDQQLIQSFPFCGKDFRTKLPALIFTEPNLNAVNPETGSLNQAKQHQYQGQLDQNSLFNFALPLMKAFSINLKKVKDYTQFSEKHPSVPKLLYFTDKQKLPTIYKILTAHFRNTIAFAHVQKGSPLAEHFNVTSFPKIILNGKQQIPLSKNLTQMINRLDAIKGQQAEIFISQVQTSKIQQITSQNIQKLVYELPEHTLIHVVDSNTGQQHPQWKKCQQNFRKMFTYYEASEKLGKQIGVKQTPAIVYFPKSVAKKNVQKTIFTSQNTFRNIYDEISSLIDDFTVPIANDLEMQKLTSIPLQEGKFIAVLFHEQQISLSYRVLSNDQDYKKDIVFFRMKNPDQTVRQKFQVKKLPSLFVMINDPQAKNQNGKKKDEEQPKEGRVQMNLQLAQYTGKFNYDELTRYFSMFSKKKQNTAQTQTPEDLSKVNIVELKSKAAFNKVCTQQNCYLLLVDGRQSKKESNQNYKNQVKKFVGKVADNFAFVDALCHSEILAPLQIQLQQLPILIYLNSKFQKFSRVVGRIQQKSINVFISKVKSNKAMYRGYDKLNFDDKKNCAAQHKKIQQYQKGTSSQQTMSDVQLQIIKQLKQQEQRKRLQNQKLQKQLQKNEKRKRKRRRPKQQQSEDL